MPPKRTADGATTVLLCQYTPRPARLYSYRYSQAGPRVGWEERHRPTRGASQQPSATPAENLRHPCKAVVHDARGRPQPCDWPILVTRSTPRFHLQSRRIIRRWPHQSSRDFFRVPRWVPVGRGRRRSGPRQLPVSCPPSRHGPRPASRVNGACRRRCAMAQAPPWTRPPDEQGGSYEGQTSV
jgi:hypothetical protein